MSKHLYEEIDELHRVIERLNAARESLEAQFDQMVMECFEVVSTTDVDQNGNHIERSVPKHHLLAADVARLEAENERLRKALENIVKWHGRRDHNDELMPQHLQNAEVATAMAALEAKP